MSKTEGDLIMTDKIINNYELSKVLKLRDALSVKKEKSRMLMPDDDDEKMMQKILASVMEVNPMLYMYMKGAKMISTEAFVGHIAHYIIIDSRQMFDALNVQKNMDEVQYAIDKIRGENANQNETYLFVKWDMSIIL